MPSCTANLWTSARLFLVQVPRKQAQNRSALVTGEKQSDNLGMRPDYHEWQRV